MHIPITQRKCLALPQEQSWVRRPVRLATDYHSWHYKSRRAYEFWLSPSAVLANAAANILINGVNVEGKPITDTIAYTTTGQVLGALVFKRVTSVTIPAALGASATVTVDTTNRLGLNHRLIPNYSTIACLSATVTSPYNTANSSLKTAFPIVEAAVAGSNTDNEFVEKNWAQPATAPNGTTFLYFFYWFYKVLVYPPKDSPEFYSTTTSTSTSSTSSSTSFSSTSTSTSISSTSISTSSTSTSFSSTSTSTTTLPV